MNKNQLKFYNYIINSSNKFELYFNEISKRLNAIKFAYINFMRKHNYNQKIIDDIEYSEIIFNFLKLILNYKLNNLINESIDEAVETLLFNKLNNNFSRYIYCSYRYVPRKKMPKDIRMYDNLINFTIDINKIIFLIDRNINFIDKVTFNKYSNKKINNYIDSYEKNKYIILNNLNLNINRLNQELNKYLTCYIPYFDNYKNICREEQFIIIYKLSLCNKASYNIFNSFYKNELKKKSLFQLIISKIDINLMLNNYILKLCKNKIIQNNHICSLYLMD